MTKHAASPIKIILSITLLMSLLVGCQSVRAPYKTRFFIKTKLPTKEISKILEFAGPYLFLPLDGVVDYNEKTGILSGDYVFSTTEPIKISAKVLFTIRLMNNGQITIEMAMDDAAKTQKGIQLNAAEKQLEVSWRKLAEGLAKLLKGEIL